MQEQSKRVISLAIVTLIVYLGTLALTLIPAIKLVKHVPQGEFFQTLITAIVLYAVTIILAALRLRLGYYLMAAVVTIYGVGMLGIAISMISGATGMLTIRVLIGLVAIFGVILSVNWFMQAFKLRHLYINHRIEQMTARQRGNQK